MRRRCSAIAACARAGIDRVEPAIRIPEHVTSRTPSSRAAARSSASRVATDHLRRRAARHRRRSGRARRAWRSRDRSRRLPPRTSPASRPSPAIHRRGGRGRTSVAASSPRRSPSPDTPPARRARRAAAIARTAAARSGRPRARPGRWHRAPRTPCAPGRRTSGTSRRSARPIDSGTRTSRAVWSIDAAPANRLLEVIARFPTAAASARRAAAARACRRPGTVWPRNPCGVHDARPMRPPGRHTRSISRGGLS